MTRRVFVEKLIGSNGSFALAVAATGIVLYASYLQSTLVLHTVLELFCVAIAFGIYAVVWNTRHQAPANSMLVLGIAYLFIGVLDSLHAATYPGMAMNLTANPNTTSQLGLISRAVIAGSLLYGFLTHRRSHNETVAVLVYLGITAAAILTVLVWPLFPVTYVAGSGETPFGKIVEYSVILTLGLAFWAVVSKAGDYEKGTVVHLATSIALLAVSSFISTLYDNLHDFRFTAENIIKLASFYYMYRALAIKRLLHPYERMRTEIENRIVAEQRRIESEERYRTVFETAGSMIFTLDKDSKVFDCNGMCETTLGHSREELVGMRFVDLLQTEEGAAFLDRLASNVGSVTAPNEISMVRKDGTTLPVSVTSSAMRATLHNDHFTTLIVEDLSERKRLEEQFLQSQKLESVGRLSGGVAHDFNNMATVVTGFSELILNTYSSDETLSEWVTQIKAAAEKSAKLSHQLLAFSRKSVFRPVKLDLNRVIDEMGKMIRRLVPESIEVRFERSESLGLVFVDRSRIEQVILNLVVNARDAMPEGGRLVVSTRNDPSCQVTGQGLVLLEVHDDGIGMDRTTQDKIFEPFFTTKPPGVGTGLGLSMVYGTVEQSGGTISVSSEIGAGTTFSIRFPQLIEEPDKNLELDEGGTAPGGSETILVVEDDDSVMEMMKTVLPRLGYTMLAARTGVEALEIMQESEHQVADLVITDIVMPGMGGADLSDRLLRLHPDIKILFVSGYAPDTMVMPGLLDREKNYLEKPFSHLNLAKRIRSLLDGS